MGSKPSMKAHKSSNKNKNIFEFSKFLKSICQWAPHPTPKQYNVLIVATNVPKSNHISNPTTKPTIQIHQIYANV